MRGATSTYTIIVEEYDQLTGKMRTKKKHAPWKRTSIEPTRDSDEEGQGGVFEDELAGGQLEEQTLALELHARIAALAQVTEQLRFQGSKALAEVGEALLGYVREQMQAAHSDAQCALWSYNRRP